MAIPMTTQQELDLSDPTIPKLVHWCLLLQPDEGDIAIVNSNADVDFNSVTYEAQLDRWEVEGAIDTGQALVAETIAFSFDAGLQYESNNFVADLLARTWHFRPFRLDMVISNRLTGDFIINPRTIYGFMDSLDTSDNLGSESTFILSCETGTFRAIDRNATMASDVDQRKRNATDGFFQNLATIGGKEIPFGVASSVAPGVAGTQGSGGGGGGGGGRWRIAF